LAGRPAPQRAAARLVPVAGIGHGEDGALEGGKEQLNRTWGSLKAGRVTGVNTSLFLGITRFDNSIARLLLFLSC